MIEEFFVRPHVWRRMQRGPLATAFGPYVEHLQQRGYGRVTVQQYVQAVEHFGCWMTRRGRCVADIDDGLVTEFMERHLCRCRCQRQRARSVPTIRAALRQLLAVLSRPQADPPAVAPSLTTSDGIIDDFGHHLSSTCGLATTTCRRYQWEVRGLLVAQFGEGTIEIETLRSVDIGRFVASRARRLCPASANSVSNAMRAFVRFLSLRGVDTAGRPSQVPRAAVWPLSSVPRVLSDAELAAFLAAFDRTTPLGRRDYAIAVCLVVLGLRAGEAAALTLDDIDWRAETLTIPRSKSRQRNSIPMPEEVAAALSGYLQFGRPSTAERAVFVHHRAPRGAGGKASLIRVAARRAYARAGLDPSLTGTHVLRHTAATRLLRAGASMKEIADVLGHRCLDTSAIYTKVDGTALRGVALAWREEQP